MVANESWVNLEEVIGWAEAHQEEVAKIVENATAFALRHLSAQGRSASVILRGFSRALCRHTRVSRNSRSCRSGR